MCARPPTEPHASRLCRSRAASDAKTADEVLVPPLDGPLDTLNGLHRVTLPRCRPKTQCDNTLQTNAADQDCGRRLSSTWTQEFDVLAGASFASELLAGSCTALVDDDVNLSDSSHTPTRPLTSSRCDVRRVHYNIYSSHARYHQCHRESTLMFKSSYTAVGLASDHQPSSCK